MAGKREIKKEKRPKKATKLWLIPAIAAAAAISGYAGFCVAASTSDAINPHTLVFGRDVGGLTRSEAVQTLTPALDLLRTESGVHATLENGEDAAYLTYDELGVTFNAAALAEEAYGFSHSGNPLTDGWNLLRAALGVHTAVTPEPDAGWQADAAKLLADASDLPASDFSYAVGENVLTLTKARDGRDVDRDTLRSRLNDAVMDESGSRYVSLPYTAIAARQGDLGALSESLGGQMANARYDAETQSIVPERPAFNFNVQQAQMLLDAAAPGEQVTVPGTTETPSVTAEELEDVLFRDVLSTYTTRVNGTAGRRANVKLTAELSNGIVLNSGEEFNYFEVAGPFTAANGYKPAPGYLNGKTVDMDGGGACQCSSTIYAAVLLANLEVVARTAHGFASDYIGLGLDATVANGGPDFIFRNNTPYPIKIEAVYSNDHRLTINLLGTKTDETYVKMRTAVISSTPYTEEIYEDESVAPGERRVEQTPYTGYVADTYREIFDKDGKLISSTFETRSRYKSRNRIILVAPGELEAAAGGSVPATEETPEQQPSPDPAPAPTPDPAPLPAPEPEPAPLPPEIPGGLAPIPIGEQIGGLGERGEGADI